MAARALVFTARKQDTGRTVGDVIRKEFGLVAHDFARAKYRTENGITVDGKPAMANRRLEAGETLRVLLEDGEPGRSMPARGPLSVLYEDEDVIAVDKPAGMVVHPSHGHFADTLANYLAQYFLDRGEPHEIRPAGRLDKDTSGVLLFGKSRTACAHLAAGASRNKQYLALASGVFANPEGTVRAPISREYEEKIRRVVRPDGAEAVTHYRVLRQYADCALLTLTLETGRTHQIRVHMAYLGHPLLGDPIYGSGVLLPEQCTGRTMEAYPAQLRLTDGERAERIRANRGFVRTALHAWRVTFLQPFSREPVAVTAPLPADFRRVIAEEGDDFRLVREEGTVRSGLTAFRPHS